MLLGDSLMGARKLAQALLCNDRVLLTGASGLIGTHVARVLDGVPRALIRVSRQDCDLRDASAVEHLLADTFPTVVIHMAAVAQGIGYKADHPAGIFDDNVRMNFNVLRSSGKRRIRKFVGIGSTSEYSSDVSPPWHEDRLWDGYPHASNAYYGLAKRMMLAQSMAYRDEYGLDAIHLVPVTVYGPHDDYSENATRFIPMLFRRYAEAVRKNAEVVACWGTGKPTRDLMYVTDAAKGVVRATCLYSSPKPANLGTGHEVTVSEVADKIAKLVGYSGETRWDIARPSGTARSSVDTQRAEAEFGFRAGVRVDKGLRLTAAWFTADGL